MKILVIGATGFIGGHLTRALCGAGHAVACLRRSTSSTAQLDGLPVDHRIGDIFDPASVREAVRGREAVFHLAGAYSVWAAQDEKLYRTNVLGTRHVAEACLAEGARLVKTGSCVTYAGTEQPVVCDESMAQDPLRWSCHHVVTMALAEREVLQACARGLWAVQLHPALVVGEHDVNFHGAWVLVDAEARRHPWASRFVPGGGINVVAVEDVVSALLLALERGRGGESYLIGGENLTRKELIGLAEEVVHGERRLRLPLPRLPLRALGLVGEAIGRLQGLDAENRLALNDVAARLSSLYWWISSQKATRELGYRPGPVRPALERMWRWYRTWREERRSERAGAGA